MEHSRLDFPAAGAASDFSSFISAKSILCTVLSYVAVIALILISSSSSLVSSELFGRALRSLQLKFIWLNLKNKKAGDAGSHYGRAHP